MKETKNLKLKIPEKNEYINIADINENAEKIDEELAKKADASGGDISETVITTVEASQDEYPVPAAGDSAKTVLGKVQKFFADIRNWMKGVCLLGQIVNNCVTDNAKLPLSAAQGKVLMDLYNVLNTKTQGLPLKMVVGSCNVDCKTYDSFLKAYVGGATIDTLSNFVNGCIVVPIQARTQYYEPGVVSITVNSDNWIRVQCDTETVAEVRCLLISQSS